jgi:hypothetical protein
MHTSLSGIPAETRQLKVADANANFNWWMLMGLAGSATMVATILIPPFRSLPGSLQGISRFALAAVLIVGLIFITVAGMSATGYFLN